MSKTEKLSKESFNEAFCSFLEYHLTRTFAKSDDKTINSLWCDGIQMPLLDQLTKKSVNDTRKIVTKAWIGIDGQEEYDMIMFFGKYSLRRYAKGTNLEDCVPKEEISDWIRIDAAKRVIEIQLN